MSIERLIASLLRNWVALAFFCLVSGVVGFYGTYALKEKYKATALVLVRPEEIPSIARNKRQKELLNFPVSTSQVTTDNSVNTYVKIIESRVMAEKVVRKLKLDVETVEDDDVATLVGKLKKWAKPVIKWGRTAVIDARNFLFHGRTFEPLSDFEEAVEDYLKEISVMTGTFPVITS